MIHLTKKNLEAAKLNPFYMAYNLYSGSLLIEKWKESQTQAIKDIKLLEDETLKERLLAEVSKITNPKDWALYIIRKYSESFAD